MHGLGAGNRAGRLGAQPRREARRRDGYIVGIKSSKWKVRYGTLNVL